MFTLDTELRIEGYNPKNQKTKSEIKRELEELIAKGSRNENVDMQDNVNGCITNEDAVKAIPGISTNNPE